MQHFNKGPTVPHDLFKIVFFADFFLEIDIFRFELMLQFFHLHKSSLQLRFRALPLQFSRSPRRKNLEHVDGAGIVFHRLIIKGGDMPYDTSHSI